MALQSTINITDFGGVTINDAYICAQGVMVQQKMNPETRTIFWELSFSVMVYKSREAKHANLRPLVVYPVTRPFNANDARGLLTIVYGEISGLFPDAINV